jgi:hypothetical protein
MTFVCTYSSEGISPSMLCLAVYIVSDRGRNGSKPKWIKENQFWMGFQNLNIFIGIPEKDSQTTYPLQAIPPLFCGAT